MTTDPFLAFVDTFDTRLDGPYCAALAVRDVDLPSLADGAGHVRVVLTGGAAQVAGPVGFCDRRDDLILDAVDTTVRDLDDPSGNARRVVTAAADLLDDVALHVRVTGEPTPRWLSALDVLAEVEAVVALPLPQVDPEPWIGAALDRELAVSLVGGTVEQAVGALRITARLWGDADDLRSARRWCRSWLVDEADDAAAAATALASSAGPR